MKIDLYLINPKKKELVSLPVTKTPSLATIRIFQSLNPLQSYYDWYRAEYGESKMNLHRQKIEAVISAHPEKELRVVVN